MKADGSLCLQYKPKHSEGACVNLLNNIIQLTPQGLWLPWPCGFCLFSPGENMHQAWILSCETGLKSKLTVVGVPCNRSATLAQMSISFLEGCTMGRAKSLAWCVNLPPKEPRNRFRIALNGSHYLGSFVHLGCFSTISPIGSHQFTRRFSLYCGRKITPDN